MLRERYFPFSSSHLSWWKVLHMVIHTGLQSKFSHSLPSLQDLNIYKSKTCKNNYLLFHNSEHVYVVFPQLRMSSLLNLSNFSLFSNIQILIWPLQSLSSPWQVQYVTSWETDVSQETRVLCSHLFITGLTTLDSSVPLFLTRPQAQE